MSATYVANYNKIKIKCLKLIDGQNPLTSNEESFKQEVCPHFGRSHLISQIFYID
jgi:hypothetical protein